MIEDKNIPHVLNQTRPSLSTEEKASLWSSVEASIPPAQPILSPYSFITFFKQKYIMVPIALFLTLILGGGATVYASDVAKPGDFLFPIDRLVENVQLDLTFSEEGKGALVDKFTQERLDEIHEIINQEASISASNVDASSASSTDVAGADATLEDLEVSIDVFTDTTVVKLEIAGNKFYFETAEVEQQKVIDEIISRFPVLTDVFASEAQRSGFLTFQVAGRTSLPSDRGIVEVTPEGKQRIAGAVDALLTFLDETSSNDDSKDTLVSAISQEVDALTQTIEVTRNDNEFTVSSDDDALKIVVGDNGDSSIAVRTDSGSVTVEDVNDEITRQEEDFTLDSIDIVSARDEEQNEPQKQDGKYKEDDFKDERSLPKEDNDYNYSEVDEERYQAQEIKQKEKREHNEDEDGYEEDED